MTEDCIFCEIEDGNRVKGDYNRHIIDTQHFFVVAGRGQICDGYMIICARKHLFNMSLLEEEEWAELMRLKSRIRRMVKEIYGCDPLFFEHGDADCTNRGGSCISHAHIHVVPLTLKKVPQMLHKFSLFYFDSPDEWKHFAVLHSPYFTLELSDGKIIMIHETNLPCQFGRQLLVTELGLPVEWDWRKGLDAGRMRRTIEECVQWRISCWQ